MASDSPIDSKHEFGPYTLLRELGRGGQGTVWLAEDRKLGRRIALKVLNTGPATGSITDREVARFRREAEAASRLDHPNICTLLDAGEVDGVPFLAFRYVDGETLVARIARAAENRRGEPGADAGGSDTDPSSRTGIQRIVHTFEKVARALHQAHEKGLIHRDIKPGNIMLTADQGEPVILDFGLARDEIGDPQSLTHSGDLLGTPAYMSPEQLMAHRVPLDRRTDIYSLGATLYECLTLKRPFTALTRAELYQQILHADPSTASSVNPQIPRDLQVVVETAMEKDRNRRYQSALDLAEDLRRLREFEPIRARPIGRVLRIRRYCQRHPARAVGVGGLLAALGLSIAWSLQQGASLRRQAASLRTARAMALANASGIVVNEDQLLALLLAAEAVRLERGPETLSRLYSAMASTHERVRLPHPGWVQSVVASADRRLLLTACADGKARIWDVSTAKVIEEFEQGGSLRDARFSPDGSHVVIASSTGVALWSRASLAKPVREFVGHTSAVIHAAFDHDGRTLLTASGDGAVRLWPVHTADDPVVVIDRPLPATAAALSPDGRLVAAAHADGVVTVADRTGKRIQTMDCRLNTVNHVTFSKDGARVLTSASDMLTRVWDVATGREEAVFRGNEGSTFSSTYSTDETRILTTSSDMSARLFDRFGYPLAVFRGHRNIATTGSFLGEDTVATSSRDGTVRVWDLFVTGFPVLYGHEHLVRSACFDGTGRRLVTSSGDGTVRTWDDRGGLLSTWAFARSGFALFLPGDDQVAGISGEGHVAVWDVREGGRSRVLREAGGEDVNINVSISGNRIAIPSRDHVWIGRFDDGTELCRLSGKPFQSVEWTPDGSRVITSHRDGSVSLWNASTGAQEWTHRCHESELRGVSVSPDGRRFVTACADGTSRIFTMERQLVHELIGHRGAVTWTAWSPRGDRILTTSRDRTARLWNPDTGRTEVVLRGHVGQVWHGSFSPTGDRVVTTSWDRTARIWPVDPERVIALARARLATARFTRSDLSPFADLLGERIDELVAR